MKKHVSFLIKPTSFDCNLFCDYCFYRKTAEEYPETAVHRMSLDTFETLVKKAQTSGRTTVSYIWQGGEPMLMGLDFYRAALDIQERHRKDGMMIANTIQTNAVLVDEAWAKLFADHRFLVGVSLDGPKELYDLHRFTRTGTSVFDRVMRACDTLTAHDVDFNILAVVNNDTVRYPREIYRFLAEQDFHYLQFIECLEVVDGEIAPFSVDPGLFGDFLCDLFDEWFAHGYPTTSIRLFDNLLQWYVGKTPECCMYKNECGGYFVVEHNGDIFPCDFFVTREWKLGSILEHSIEELDDMPLHRHFSSLREIEHEKCESCPWLGFCMRGCIKFRYLPDMRYESLNYMCGAYTQFFEYSRERYAFLARDIMRRHRGEPPPAEPGRNEPCYCGSGRKYKKCCEKYSFILRK